MLRWPGLRKRTPQTTQGMFILALSSSADAAEGRAVDGAAGDGMGGRTVSQKRLPLAAACDGGGLWACLAYLEAEMGAGTGRTVGGECMADVGDAEAAADLASMSVSAMVRIGSAPSRAALWGLLFAWALLALLEAWWPERSERSDVQAAGRGSWTAVLG